MPVVRPNATTTPAILVIAFIFCLLERFRLGMGLDTSALLAWITGLDDADRGAIAGALKKKFSLEVASEEVEGRGRVYRIR
ncbi:MAG: DUF3489 domain-containing protein [Bauldia sp.]|nr:DUF3489 domain-containing protein [Bauldia sp.]